MTWYNIYVYFANYYLFSFFLNNYYYKYHICVIFFLGLEIVLSVSGNWGGAHWNQIIKTIMIIILTSLYINNMEHKKIFEFWIRQSLVTKLVIILNYNSY